MNEKKIYYTYLLSNKSNKVLYVGFTENLKRRILEHRNHRIKGFTDKYNVEKLVYFESLATKQEAMLREKQIKAGSRAKKDSLINKTNPEWQDLFYKID